MGSRLGSLAADAYTRVLRAYIKWTPCVGKEEVVKPEGEIGRIKDVLKLTGHL